MRLARFGLALAALLSLLTLPANAQVVSGSVRTAAPTYVNGESRPISLDTSGHLRVVTDGPAASGATAAGDPIPVGCDFNTTRPTVTTGQRITLQCTNRGAAFVAIGDTGGTTVGVEGNTVDTVVGGTVGLVTKTLNYVFDGTQFVRQRGDIVGTVTQPGLSATHWTYAAAASGISNTTTAVTIKTAAGAGIRNCITSVQISNGTLGAATEVAIRDGAAGTVVWRGFVGTAVSSSAMEFTAPICGTANTLLEVVTLTATVTGGVYVNVQGFTRA